MRIPLSGADFAFHTKTINNALYLELSSDITEEKTSLKAYFVNERAITDPYFTPQTDSIQLLNQNYLESGMTEEDAGRTTTIRVGTRDINITLQEIIQGSTPSTGSVNATIAVSN